MPNVERWEWLFQFEKADEVLRECICFLVPIYSIRSDKQPRCSGSRVLKVREFGVRVQLPLNIRCACRLLRSLRAIFWSRSVSCFWGLVCTSEYEVPGVTLFDLSIEILSCFMIKSLHLRHLTSTGPNLPILCRWGHSVCSVGYRRCTFAIREILSVIHWTILVLLSNGREYTPTLEHLGIFWGGSGFKRSPQATIRARIEVNSILYCSVRVSKETIVSYSVNSRGIPDFHSGNIRRMYVASL